MHGVTMKFTLKFVHNISAYIMKFVFSCGILVHNKRKLYLYRFLQWFISGGHQVYVLVAIW